MMTVVASLVSGILLLKDSLESRRPQQQAALFRANAATEIVPARLWQDPLHSTQSHWHSVLSHKDGHKTLPPHLSLPPTIKDFSKKLRNRKACQPERRLLVLLVVMRGGPYAEDREDRRRQRHAVVSALTENDYVPEDAERIGYVVAPSFNEYYKEDDKDGVISPHRMLIGFEFHKRSIEAKQRKESCGKGKYEHPWESVLVLWLNSRDFDTCSLQRVSALIAALDGKRSCDATVLLGPVTSGALAAMGTVKGCKNTATQWLKSFRKNSNAGVRIKDYISQLHILSPRATVPLYWLFPGRQEYKPNNSCDAKCVDARFGEFLEVSSFNSVVASDNRVLKEILNELISRGAQDPLIAVVSEQDSAYGRLLDDILDEVVIETGSRFKVREYGYLQGVDGELPPGSSKSPNGLLGTSDDKTNSNRTIEGPLMATGHREQSFGVSQLDYVRRLADHIAYDVTNSKHQEQGLPNDRSDEEDGARPVVIGILGTDVYDKLLILQALRERLPRATFFTTDLDARLAHPYVYAWTRNLIVGSSYGFTVMGLEGAGFRDSYQTALYRAVTLSLEIDSKKSEKIAPYPRLFEIGRTGVVDITEQRNATLRTGYHRIHGEIPYIRSKSTWLPRIGSAFVTLIPLIALTIYAFVRGLALHDQIANFRRKAHLRVAKFGGCGDLCSGNLDVLLAVARLRTVGRFSRALAASLHSCYISQTLVFAYAIIDITWGRMKQSEHDIHHDLGLPKSSGNPTWKIPYLLHILWRQKGHSKPWIWQWKRDLSSVKGTPPKKAAECWTKYLDLSGIHARVTRILIPLFFSFILVVLMFDFISPTAQLLTRHLYRLADIVLGLAIFATLVTVYFCNDTLMLGSSDPSGTHPVRCRGLG